MGQRLVSNARHSKQRYFQLKHYYPTILIALAFASILIVVRELTMMREMLCKDLPNALMSSRNSSNTTTSLVIGRAPVVSCVA